ncbi:two-component sensor histidine kinase [Lentzea sp. NBRC 105346]|uniref:sensor histidine kinase n=1 Tax=Lentzea sp. NBRC 105346 TaxID=3032205 RepID=UPI0024A48B5E|nr:histidine kinase [Lentzea sp. NBRC 105346]GLZ32279.1 two-component sensor histidine kinase [Lentzea sp. NBRC 105346]
MKVLAREILIVGLCASVALIAPDRPFEWSSWTSYLGCFALPLRLRWPGLAALLCIPGVAGGLGWAPAFVAQYRVGRTERSVPIMVLWVTALTAASIVPVMLTEVIPLGSLLLATAFAFGLAAAPTALGVLVATRRELTRSLQEARRARAAELEAQETSARASERARIAREIHDAVGHHATLIAVESAALAATTSDPVVRETALRLRGLAKESLAEMRTALGLLSSGVTYRSLDELIDRARSVGVAVTLSESGSADLSPAVERAVFRVVQEALTNVTKHAPGASVSVDIFRGPSVTVTVANGPSSEVPLGGDGGQGLHGLSERVRTVGGTFRTSRRPDGGFVVTAVLPTGTSKVGENDSTFGGGERGAATA